MRKITLTPLPSLRIRYITFYGQALKSGMSRFSVKQAASDRMRTSQRSPSIAQERSSALGRGKRSVVSRRNRLGSAASRFAGGFSRSH